MDTFEFKTDQPPPQQESNNDEGEEGGEGGIFEWMPLGDDVKYLHVQSSEGVNRYVTMKSDADVGLEDGGDDANSSFSEAHQANLSMLRFLNRQPQHQQQKEDQENEEYKKIMKEQREQQEMELQQQKQRAASGVNINRTAAASASASSSSTTTSAASSSTSNSSGGEQLWVSRYGATRFSELLSDERVNLDVLQWMTAWKKNITAAHQNNNSTSKSSSFGKKKPGGGGNQNQNQQQQAALAAVDPICLISGPPGVGKTSLAHVTAKHCGFDVIEVNASYSRSAVEMKNLIETATQESFASANSFLQDGGNKSNNNNNNNNSSKNLMQLLKPKCLILDEIDGSTTNVIKILLAAKLHRPVLCLANNLYAPVLRDLRARVSFVRQIPPLLPQRIVARLEAIAEMEKISIDRHSLMDLSLHCGGDIRQCLNTLFFVSRQLPASSMNRAGAASRMLRLLRVREPLVSIWGMWEQVLERKEKNKYIQNLATAGVMSKEEASSLSNLDPGALWLARCASKCPEIETVLNGLHEWYCQLTYPDYTFSQTANLTDSFAWVDRADPFTGQFSSICEATAVEVFRSCATLTPRPPQVKNVMPREATHWRNEAQYSNELIAQFLEKSFLESDTSSSNKNNEKNKDSVNQNQNQQNNKNKKNRSNNNNNNDNDEDEEDNSKSNKNSSLHHTVMKSSTSSQAAALDVLPLFSRLISRVPISLKLAPGVSQIENVRNMRDAETLKRLSEVMHTFGINFSHSSSSSSSGGGAGAGAEGRGEGGGAESKKSRFSGGGSRYNNNREEWKMQPDLEHWVDWTTSNKKSQQPQFYFNKETGKMQASSDPTSIVRAAAAGISSRDTRSVWDKNTKPLPKEVRELLVGEIAQRELQQLQRQHAASGAGAGGGARRDREEKDFKDKLNSAPTTTTTSAATPSKTSASSSTAAAHPTPPNAAAAAAKKSSSAAATTTTATVTVARDFFGRPIVPKAKPAAKKSMMTAASREQNGDSKQQEQEQKQEEQQEEEEEVDDKPVISAADLLVQVKYRFFDGSSNAVRKPATRSDFL